MREDHNEALPLDMSELVSRSAQGKPSLATGYADLVATSRATPIPEQREGSAPSTREGLGNSLRQDNEAAPQVLSAIEQSRNSGKPLDASALEYFETALGAEFKFVRVHTGSTADKLNEALESRAFATGRDIFFRGGEYQPNTGMGRGLLAHELTHVAQNADGIHMRKQSGATEDDEQERLAERAAQAVAVQPDTGTTPPPLPGHGTSTASSGREEKDKAADAHRISRIAPAGSSREPGEYKYCEDTSEYRVNFIKAAYEACGIILNENGLPDEEQRKVCRSRVAEAFPVRLKDIEVEKEAIMLNWLVQVQLGGLNHSQGLQAVDRTFNSKCETIEMAYAKQYLGKRIAAQIIEDMLKRGVRKPSSLSPAEKEATESQGKTAEQQAALAKALANPQRLESLRTPDEKQFDLSAQGSSALAIVYDYAKQTDLAILLVEDVYFKAIKAEYQPAKGGGKPVVLLPESKVMSLVGGKLPEDERLQFLSTIGHELMHHLQRNPDTEK